MVELKDEIKKFANSIADGSIEIYNEFSLQHELGIYLRRYVYQSYKVQFERNVSYFGFNSQKFIKREIDISVFKEGDDFEAIIELKYPKNGQYPEQMYSFIKDIAFIEQLKASGFKKTYFIAFADDPCFYENGERKGIYGYFRGGQKLSGIIEKPTGKDKSSIKILGQYQISWNSIVGSLKYAIVEAQ